MAEVKIYASFPRVVALGPDLNLDASNWHWIHCLSLPLESLNVLKFSPRPYKWIRYATGIVVGAEGELSYNPESLDIVDYNAGLPSESVTLYYHTSDDERRRMFPVDPKMARTKSTSSVATSRMAQLRSNTAHRDGNRCVLTRAGEPACDAVHLLTRNKGDEYISTYTRRRTRDPNRVDIIEDIDSIRNTLFLNAATHSVLGKHVAFLPTPNFAMDTSDVDPTAEPGEKRWTVHLFMHNEPDLLCRSNSGDPLRTSGSADWPPAILFDAVYASTVLHYFGTQTVKDMLATTWTNTFYPADTQALTEERKQKQAQEREARRAAREAHRGPDTYDMLLALPYILVPGNERQAMFKEAEEKASAAEQRRVQEKVNAWNEQVTDSSQPPR